MYSVPQYLRMLKLAKRSPRTIEAYRNILGAFAAFLEVPVEDLHNHLQPDNLINYAISQEGLSERGRRVRLSVLQRFYKLNGVQFGELEADVLKPPVTEEQDDKPLELETLQKMMDLGDTHAKAIIAVLISTGMRISETSRIELKDIDGDTIHIRNEIAKGHRGGDVFLTTEAREYLDLWLRERDKYVKRAKTKNYATGRPEDDQRVFAVSSITLRKIFTRLYDIVDGERGKYWAKCTPHSCRKYFRTHAVKTMPLDVVEKIMRHTGYLTGSYVRIPLEEMRRAFHKGETALYLTRADHRIQDGWKSEMERDLAAKDAIISELSNKVAKIPDLEQRLETINALDKVQGQLTKKDHEAIAKLVVALQKKQKS